MSDEKQIIMERNEKGTVDVLPDTEQHIRFQMPTDRSALGVFGANPEIHDGDDFRQDGMVYNKEGKPYRKWFGNLYDPYGSGGSYGRIWEPKLEDIAALEAKRWWALEWVRRWNERVFMPQYRAICALGEGREVTWKNPIVVHARASHKRMHPEKYKWVEYHFHPNDPYFVKPGSDYPYSHSFDWIEGELDDPQHVDLGQPFYEVDQHTRVVYNRRQVFLVAFNLAISNWIWRGATCPDAEYDTHMQVDINGRFYWFESERTKDPNRRYTWKILHYPEGDLVKTTIK